MKHSFDLIRTLPAEGLNIAIEACPMHEDLIRYFNSVKKFNKALKYCMKNYNVNREEAEEICFVARRAIQDAGWFDFTDEVL